MLLLPPPIFSLLLLIPVTRADPEYQNGTVTTISADDIFQHNEEIALRLFHQPIQGVKKMSTDEGEKFFPEYWQFLDDPLDNSAESYVQEANGSLTNSPALDFEPVEEDESAGNDYPDSVFVERSHPFTPAFPIQSRSKSLGLNANLLEHRDFKCPTGTNACTSIGRSDRCCGTGDTCQIVPDTGSGDVGCCPPGQNCAGGIGVCQSGYTGCSQALGGGCCIPGYDCVPGGCEYFIDGSEYSISKLISRFRCIHLSCHRDRPLDCDSLYKNIYDSATDHTFLINIIQHKHEQSNTTRTPDKPLPKPHHQPCRRLPDWILRLFSRVSRGMLSNRTELRHDIMSNDIVNNLHLQWRDDRGPGHYQGFAWCS